jgi:hypothetical protein
MVNSAAMHDPPNDGGGGGDRSLNSLSQVDRISRRDKSIKLRPWPGYQDGTSFLSNLGIVINSGFPGKIK